MSVSEQMPLTDVKNRPSEVVDRLEREHGRVVIAVACVEFVYGSLSQSPRRVGADGYRQRGLDGWQREGLQRWPQGVSVGQEALVQPGQRLTVASEDVTVHALGRHARGLAAASRRSG